MIGNLKHVMIRASIVGLLSLEINAPVFAQMPDNTDQSLLNLGSYLGYDLTNKNPNPISNKLLDGSSTQQTPTQGGPGSATAIANNQKDAVILYLGTLLNQTIANSSLNQFANAIFKNGVFNSTASAQQAGNAPSSSSITATALVDQSPLQSNPVNQSTLNFLTTPDITFCSLMAGAAQNTPTDSSLTAKCPFAGNNSPRTQNLIGSNVTGGYPLPANFFDALSATVLNQLNGNTLIEPLLYATTNETNENNGGSLPNSSGPNGLQATTQAQEAANFIRYVSGEVAPTPKTTLTVYNLLLKNATKQLTAQSTQQEQDEAYQAQATLSTYLASQRVAAAQNSVGVSNLYDILSKRVAQQQKGSNTPTSQALNEFTMATRRLYDPSSQQTQWVDQINKASSATVQKEIAILLSEINYQLYLTRQQQERLLLTNTVMLFQLGHLVAPAPLTQSQAR